MTYILEISADRVAELLTRIKPLVRQGEQLCEIELPDPFKVAFTWDPVVTKPVDERELKWLKVITTYHAAGYIAFVKPSIAEVLAQIPAELLDDVYAFELETASAEPVTAQDFYGHRIQTVLYGKADVPVGVVNELAIPPAAEMRQALAARHELAPNFASLMAAEVGKALRTAIEADKNRCTVHVTIPLNAKATTLAKAATANEQELADKLAPELKQLEKDLRHALVSSGYTVHKAEVQFSGMAYWANGDFESRVTLDIEF